MTYHYPSLIARSRDSFLYHRGLPVLEPNSWWEPCGTRLHPRPKQQFSSVIAQQPRTLSVSSALPSPPSATTILAQVTQPGYIHSHFMWALGLCPQNGHSAGFHRASHASPLILPAEIPQFVHNPGSPSLYPDPCSMEWLQGPGTYETSSVQPLMGSIGGHLLEPTVHHEWLSFIYNFYESLNTNNQSIQNGCRQLK